MSSFDEQGITFSIIPPARYEEARSFMYTHFFPDEPLCRSLGVGQENYLLDSIYIYAALKDGSCVMATNNEDEIIGIRFGKVVNQSDYTFHLVALKYMFWWFSWFVPSSYQFISRILLFNHKINYDVYKMFDDLGDVIYEGLCVCVSVSSRVKGLGTELIKQSMQIARDRGCKSMYLVATGKYSQRIFEKLEFRVLNQFEYEDVKYDNGDIMVCDAREHTKCQIVCKQL